MSARSEDRTCSAQRITPLASHIRNRWAMPIHGGAIQLANWPGSRDLLHQAADKVKGSASAIFLLGLVGRPPQFGR
jgi:hypothetical protein